MSSDKRRWIWVLAVVAIAAAFWWWTAEEPAPAEPEIAEPGKNPPAEPEPPLRPRGEPVRGEAEPDADEPAPTAAPLPRDEIELPPTSQQSDAGVPEKDEATIDEKRDRMMRVVLDRLEDDLRTAEEAGDDAKAAQIRVRIERTKRQRDELTSP